MSSETGAERDTVVSQSQSQSQSQARAQRSVLVVEDDPSISEAIRFILARDGWNVSVCADGCVARDAVTQANPDVVILDAMLPGKSGLQILNELRAAPSTQSLPVIILTANGAASTRDLAQQAGASLFMAKPFANDDLVAAVRELAAV